jgi:hypothetical protein
MRRPRLPTFLYIGPDKTGSTWMYEVLRQHPRAFVPTTKDLYFFDRYYHRGLDWYEAFFRDAPHDALAIGELSHDYLFSAEAAQRIAIALPEARLFTSLRQPAERVLSHYLYLLRSGLTTLPFDEAIGAIPELIEKSLYFKHLRHYVERFPASQLQVFFFEDLVRDERQFARAMFSFLGLPQAEITLPGRTLPASRPRSVTLAALAKHGANLSRDLGFTSLVGVVKRSRLAGLLYKPYGAGERPELSASQRERLWEHFDPDVRQLEQLLGVSLDHWRIERTRRQS